MYTYIKSEKVAYIATSNSSQSWLKSSSVQPLQAPMAGAMGDTVEPRNRRLDLFLPCQSANTKDRPAQQPSEAKRGSPNGRLMPLMGRCLQCACASWCHDILAVMDVEYGTYTSAGGKDMPLNLLASLYNLQLDTVHGLLHGGAHPANLVVPLSLFKAELYFPSRRVCEFNSPNTVCDHLLSSYFIMNLLQTGQAKQFQRGQAERHCMKLFVITGDTPLGYPLKNQKYYNNLYLFCIDKLMNASPQVVPDALQRCSIFLIVINVSSYLFYVKSSSDQ